MKACVEVIVDMSKGFSITNKPMVKLASARSQRPLIIALAIASVLVVVIYIHDWPIRTAGSTIPKAINLTGTGVSPEVEALINNRAAPMRMPTITPQTADQFAGVPSDPIKQYGMPVPRPDPKLSKK